MTIPASTMVLSGHDSCQRSGHRQSISLPVRLLMAFTVLVVLHLFATGASAQTISPSPTELVPPTSTFTEVQPTSTSTEVPTPTPTATPVSTAVSATPSAAATLIASPTPVSTAAANPADLAVMVSAYPNPAIGGELFNLFITVINQGGTASPSTQLRVPVPPGMSISPYGGGCYPDPYTGLLDCSGATPANCVLYNPSTGQYLNTTTGQVYGSYSQCLGSTGAGAANCTLYNPTTGQYLNTTTGQVYSSYSECSTSPGSGMVNCVLYNQATGQYVNSATGQVYSSYSQCLSATGAGTANCVLYNQASGQYVNTASGQVYSTFQQCIDATWAAGSIIGSNCVRSDLFGSVDCAVSSLQPGDSVHVTVPFLVTASSGTLYGAVRVDPDNSVPEGNELNNTADFFVRVVLPLPPAVMPPPIIPPAFPPGFPPEEEPAPEDVPAPEEVPVPIEPTTPVPPVVPQPTGERWLQVLSETQAYSLTMDPLWIAQPGEWYSVALEEDGWVLAVWEHDPPDALVWIRIDPSVELVIVERPELELWLVVTTPTQAYSVTMDPLWVAETGEWYLVGFQEDGWALAVWEHDPPESQVWILIDDRVELVRM